MNKKNPDIFKYFFLTSVLFCLYLPLIVVAVNSFNDIKSTTQWGGFTLKWYKKLFTNKMLLDSMCNSLILSIFATAISVVIGTIGSVALNKFKSKCDKFFSPMVYLPVLMPEIIVGITFMQIFSILNFKFGMGTLLISHISFCVPFVLITVSARLNSLPCNNEEAARDLGANVWQAFIHVTVPELLPGMISGAVLAFAMSIDDVIISLFMSGASTTTLPVKVYSMMKVGVSPEINALSTIVMVVTFICVALVNVKRVSKNIYKGV